MRILALSHLFPHSAEPRYGIFVARQLQAMAQCGAEITLLVPRAYRPDFVLSVLGKPKHLSHKSELISYDGIDARKVIFPSLPGVWYNSYAGAFATRAAIRTVRDLHSQNPFDVIYATNLYVSGDMAWRLGEELKIPSTCLAIGSDINELPGFSAKLKATFDTTVDKLSGVLACGESLAEIIEQHRTDDCLCVYGVVDTEKFKPVDDRTSLRAKLSLPVEKTIFLYVGYLWKRKGLLELIRAFEQLPSNDCQLVLCGGGEDESAIREAAAKSSQKAAISFQGPVSPDSIQQYMQASDVFVLPSYNEGMPNAVMEAMACGLPVVATNVGGLPAALSDCESAILVPPKKVAPLTEALSSTLDESWRRTMGEVARAKAVESFGAIRNAQRILDFLAVKSQI